MKRRVAAPHLLAISAALVLLSAACAIESFEEREAARENGQTGTAITGEENSDPDLTAPEGPVLSADENPSNDLPAPIWVEAAFELTPIAEYESPISIVARSGTDDLYVAQRNGIIRRIQRSFNSRGAERLSTNTSVVLDISEQVTVDSERGLLDIAFSLDGRSLYVSHTDLDGDTVIAEYNISRSTSARSDSRRELLRVAQPAGNHNGGDLEIGPDGFLYIALGDGGGSGDPDRNGQNPNTLLGSLLRIDPTEGEASAYLIPPGNPFVVDDTGAPEVFLFGVRNPWRFSFDSATGDLWIADVGQNRFEEINHLPASSGGGLGANLGWNRVEAFEPFEDATPPFGAIYPVYAYAHEQGRCSVTGGHVYRGEVLPFLDGVYLFGDYCTGEVFGLDQTNEGPVVHPIELPLPRNELVSFGVGNDGEIYVVLSGGTIGRLAPAPAETIDG